MRARGMRSSCALLTTTEQHALRQQACNSKTLTCPSQQLHQSARAHDSSLHLQDSAAKYVRCLLCMRVGPAMLQSSIRAINARHVRLHATGMRMRTHVCSVRMRASRVETSTKHHVVIPAGKAGAQVIAMHGAAARRPSARLPKLQHACACAEQQSRQRCWSSCTTFQVPRHAGSCPAGAHPVTS